MMPSLQELLKADDKLVRIAKEVLEDYKKRGIKEIDLEEFCKKVSEKLK